MQADYAGKEGLVVCSALNSGAKQLRVLQTDFLLTLGGKCLGREGKLTTRDLV